MKKISRSGCYKIFWAGLAVFLSICFYNLVFVRAQGVQETAPAKEEKTMEASPGQETLPVKEDNVMEVPVSQETAPVEEDNAVEASASQETLPVKEDKTVETSPGNVSIDFKEADINNVLRILALKSGVNIVSGDDVKGKVTIRLVDVPWEKALSIVLRTYGFTYERDENIIRVTTIEGMKNEELITKTYALNYAKAKDAISSLQPMITERGRIQFDERTNTIIVSDIPQNLNRIEETIKRLDMMTAQVMIESKMVETTLGDNEKLGIDWTLQATATGSAIPTTAPFDFAKGGRAFFPSEYLPKNDATDAKFRTGTTTDFPMVTSSQFTFGMLSFSSFKAILEILKSRTDTKIISNPRIATMDNQEANILVGDKIPIPIYTINNETGLYSITGYDEQQVGVKLTVTPTVNQQNYITMYVHPEVSSISGYTGPNNERPKISTREATTKVIVRDGQTIAIGGLIKEETVDYYKKVPVLGDIPILGYVFKKKTKEVNTTDLLIFITPRIIRDEADIPQPQVSASNLSAGNVPSSPNSEIAPGKAVEN